MLKICAVIELICGLILLLMPKNKLYKPEKVKTQDEANKIIKNFRNMSIILIIMGLLFLFVF